MRESRAIGIVAGLATLGALGGLFLACRELPPRLNTRLHRAIGAVMAHQALSLLQPGGQLTLITRDTTEFKQPALKAQFEAFNHALRKAHATVKAVQCLRLDPLRPVEVPPGDFFELIRHTPAGSVIVSFLGPFVPTEEQRRQLGEIRPRIVAFCPGSLAYQMDFRLLFEQHLLHAAVVSRRTPAATAAAPSGASEAFDQYYVAINANNVASLYRGLEAAR